MISSPPKRLWLPYFVATVGMLFTFLLSYLFYLDAQANNAVMNQLENHLPWLAMLVGAPISFLLASLTRVTQLAKYRALSLDRINENLKKEISERLQAEESKQKLEVALHQGQKLQAMGTLAGGIAHDFNNLLYAIIGYVEMARDDVDQSSKLYQNLGKVLEAASRGQELVSRILSFSRRQHHEHTLLQLKPTIDAVLALLRPTIPASVTIIFEAKTDCVIDGNQTQIHQILVNMINNAVDAMDGEGVIKLSLAIISNSDPIFKRFEDLPNHEKNYCQITVSDTGHGMEPHTLARIFEPFYTTKEVGKGTGLGLSIVHSIVKEHEGDITVTSELGHGTTFFIVLPIETANQGELNGKNIVS